CDAPCADLAPQNALLRLSSPVAYSTMRDALSSKLTYRHFANLPNARVQMGGSRSRSTDAAGQRTMSWTVRSRSGSASAGGVRGHGYISQSVPAICLALARAPCSGVQNGELRITGDQSAA